MVQGDAVHAAREACECPVVTVFLKKTTTDLIVISYSSELGAVLSTSHRYNH